MEEFVEILQSYSPDCRPTAIEPLGSAGGLSGAQFWRVDAPRGALVLRCWPIEHPTPEGLRFIHAVLRHAADRGLGILPVPIATIGGATFLRHAGCLWELAPWLPGTADYQHSPSADKLRAAMCALADFHRATEDFNAAGDLCVAGPNGSAPAVTHRLDRLRNLRSGGIDSLTRAIRDDTRPELAPLAVEFTALLPRVVPLALAELAPLADVPLPLQPSIRDVWHDHVLFTGDAVTGLIDFGAMQIDTPATDIARLLGSLVGDDATGWREGLAAYSAVRPLTAKESQAIPALDTAGTILALVNWTRWIYVDKRQFDDQPLIVARVEQLLARLRVVSRRA